MNLFSHNVHLRYHYTSVDTLMKILNGIEENNFIFHASSIFSMNDSSEFKFGFNYIWNKLPAIEAKLSISESKYMISRMYEKDNSLSEDSFKDGLP